VTEPTNILFSGDAAEPLPDEAITIIDRRTDAGHRDVDPALAPAPQRDGATIPRHIALIMDGNGRWATRRGAERIAGHEAGEAAITSAIEAALATGVRWLTLFAFSTENWDRPQAEVDFLMNFNRSLIEKHGAAYYRRGVRFRYMGARTRPVPSVVAEAMTNIELATADATTLTLTFAFNYGGRDEIVGACRRLIEVGVDPAELDETRFAAELQYPDAPDPDVIVRTAGEYRLSNFLLWQAAYAELVFLDLPWPDFRQRHFDDVLRTYAARTRTYGSVPARSRPLDPALALPARMPALPPFRGAAGRRHRGAARAAGSTSPSPGVTSLGARLRRLLGARSGM
jgi:undecaprenyl diphosphate synthase